MHPRPISPLCPCVGALSLGMADIMRWIWGVVHDSAPRIMPHVGCQSVMTRPRRGPRNTTCYAAALAHTSVPLVYTLHVPRVRCCRHRCGLLFLCLHIRLTRPSDTACNCILRTDSDITTPPLAPAGGQQSISGHIRSAKVVMVMHAAYPQSQHASADVDTVCHKVFCTASAERICTFPGLAMPTSVPPYHDCSSSYSSSGWNTVCHLPVAGPPSHQHRASRPWLHTLRPPAPASISQYENCGQSSPRGTRGIQFSCCPFWRRRGMLRCTAAVGRPRVSRA